MSWTVSPESGRRARARLREIDRAVAARQGRDAPYYGAIGGQRVWHCRVHPDGRLEGWVENALTHDRVDVEVVLFAVPEAVRERFAAFATPGLTYVWAECYTTLGAILSVVEEETGRELQLTDFSDW